MDTTLHNDHLGTPQVMTDANAQVLWWRDQAPFGQTVAEGGFSASPLRFPGQYADAESGLAYNYFRDYDPALGRYIQSDPIGLRGGPNTFGYVGGNPLRFMDPLGLQDAFTLYPGQQTSDAVRRTLEDGIEYAGDAVGGAADFARNYSDMVDANTIGADLYFHCKANCEAAQRGKGGEDAAICISDVREWVDQNIKGDPPHASAVDQGANRFGRANGKNNPSSSCQLVCAPFRPKGLQPIY